MKKFYLQDGENPIGPLSIEELKEKGINKETLIWFDSLSDWTKAEQVEELKDLFIIKPPPIKKTNTENIASHEELNIKQKNIESIQGNNQKNLNKKTNNKFLLPFILILIILPIIIFVIIKQQKQQDINIYEEYHNSVVMLYHKFVYKATIEGDNLYFNFDEKTGNFSNLSSELDKAETQAMSNYGTGFFISSDGKIATNRHVINNLNTEIESKAKNYFQEIIYRQKFYYDSLKVKAEHQINIWTNEYYNKIWQDEKDNAYSEIQQWTSLRDSYSRELNKWDRISNSITNIKFEVETIYLGYALDGSFIKRITDFNECQIVKVSKEIDIDLAVIQSNLRKLPDGITNFIKLEDISVEPLKIGDEVSLLGYNLGPEISSTTTGLKIQNTSGKVSQESNGTRILYSINALPGSSGSPIFNKSGKLVAINYYGYSSQAFNYGILAKHLSNLMKE